MALSNSSVDKPVYRYDLLRTIDAFLSIAIRTTFYERDSLLLRKHVLPVVDKNRNIDTYALNTYALDTSFDTSLITIRYAKS